MFTKGSLNRREYWFCYSAQMMRQEDSLMVQLAFAPLYNNASPNILKLRVSCVPSVRANALGCIFGSIFVVPGFSCPLATVAVHPTAVLILVYPSRAGWSKTTPDFESSVQSGTGFYLYDCGNTSNIPLQPPRVGVASPGRAFEPVTEYIFSGGINTNKAISDSSLPSGCQTFVGETVKTESTATYTLKVKNRKATRRFRHQYLL
jgi:hypothetical protein